MLVMSLLQWWYGEGWRQRAVAVNGRLDSVMDYFSLGLLAKTLFAPFRQISAGRVDGPLGVQMRAMADKLISRMIGGMIRSVLLVVGCIAIALQALLGLVILVVWLFVPVLPLVGAVLMFMGVGV